MTKIASQSERTLARFNSKFGVDLNNLNVQQPSAFRNISFHKTIGIVVVAIISFVIFGVISVTQVFAQDEVTLTFGSTSNSFSTNGPQPLYSQGSENPESEDEEAPAMRVVEEGQTIRFRVVMEDDEPVAETTNFNIVWTQTGEFLDSTNLTQVVVMEAGEFTKRFTIDTIDDDLDEENGIATATLVPGEGYSVGDPSSASVIVADNDETPTLSIAAVSTSINEGETAQFRISTNQLKSAGPLTINLYVEPGASSQDFLVGNRTRTITLPAASTEVELNVETQYDSVDEPDGGLSVNIESGDGYNVATPPNNKASVAVNGLPPVVFIRDGKSAMRSITEGEDVRFVLVANARSKNQLDVNIVWSQTGDFINGSSLNQTVAITAGQVSQQFTIGTVDDEVVEANGVITATLASGSNYTVSDQYNSASINVADNDESESSSLPIIFLKGSSIPDDKVIEGFDIFFQFISDRRVDVPLEVNYTITQTGNFIRTDLYNLNSLSAIIYPNSLTTLIEIPTISDTYWMKSMGWLRQHCRQAKNIEFLILIIAFRL